MFPIDDSGDVVRNLDYHLNTVQSHLLFNVIEWQVENYVFDNK